MSTFEHPASKTPIHLLPESSPQYISQQELLDFPAFKTWHATLTRSLSLQHSDPTHPFHQQPFKLHSITVTSVDRFGGKRLGFVKISAQVQNDAGDKLPGIAVLRGGSVGMLVVLTLEDSRDQEEYALLTIQPRVPAGSLGFVEIPAGMLDDAGSFAGAAAKEIEEECGIVVREQDLVDMTQLISSMSPQPEAEELQKGVYSSAGGQDEFMPLLLCRKSVSRAELDAFRGRLTGERGSGEKITLKVVRLADVLVEAWRDGKAVAAVSFYHVLRDRGML